MPVLPRGWNAASPSSPAGGAWYPSQRRPRENWPMRITHVSEFWPETSYEIDSDRFGNYTIRSEGRVIKRVTSVSQYPGKPKWGSKKLEVNAIEDAKASIAKFRSPSG